MDEVFYSVFEHEYDQKGQRGSAEGLLMAGTIGTPSGDLSQNGISPSGLIHWNLEAKALIELAHQRGEGVYSAHKALVTETGESWAFSK